MNDDHLAASASALFWKSAPALGTALPDQNNDDNNDDNEGDDDDDNQSVT